MTPEEKARIKINRMFADPGWQVVNRDEYEPTNSFPDFDKFYYSNFFHVDL